MEQTFLHGTVRERLQDLMKSRKVSQVELAARIDCSESMLSRFLSGKTDKLGNESVIRIARVFNVSTDFLLGETDVPDCVTYDVSELGLSVQAARNLYTQKVNPKAVNALLENPVFAETTELIYVFLNDEFAKGIPHTTLQARSCATGTPSPLDSPATKPPVSLDSSPQQNCERSRPHSQFRCPKGRRPFTIPANETGVSLESSRKKISERDQPRSENFASKGMSRPKN